MTTVRVSHNRENPFVPLNKEVLRNPKLSRKAKGLWAEMLSYPDDWEFNLSHLIKQGTEGRIAICSAMDELMEAGLMLRLQFQGRHENGRHGFLNGKYIIFEFVVSPDEKKKIIAEEEKMANGTVIQNKFTQAGFMPAQTSTAQKSPLLKKEKKLKNEEQQTQAQTTNPKSPNPKPPDPVLSASLKNELKIDEDSLPLFHESRKYLKGLSEDERKQVQLHYEKQKNTIKSPIAWLTVCVKGGWYKEELLSDEDLKENYKFARKIEDNFVKLKFQGIDSYFYCDSKRVSFMKGGKEIPTPSYGMGRERYKSLMTDIMQENHSQAHRILQ